MCFEKNGLPVGTLMTKWARMSDKETKTRDLEAKYMVSLFKIIAQ